MGSYKIKDLESLSGIKAHTIRIWEQRYKLLEPDRTGTNMRRYSDTQLKKLLNIAVLNENGFKISLISQMTDDEMRVKIQELYEANTDYKEGVPPFINGLIEAMIDLNEDQFEKIFSRSILRFGFEKTIVDIIYPFLQRVGVMWNIDAIHPAQEHFVSNLIRQKLITAIDGVMLTPRKDDHYILFLPEGELHELGLLFLCYALKSRRYKVTYLGQTVPLTDLVEVANLIEAKCYLLTSLVLFPENDGAIEYLKRLIEKVGKEKIIVHTKHELPEDLRDQIKHEAEAANLLKMWGDIG